MASPHNGVGSELDERGDVIRVGGDERAGDVVGILLDEPDLVRGERIGRPSFSAGPQGQGRPPGAGMLIPRAWGRVVASPACGGGGSVGAEAR